MLNQKELSKLVKGDKFDHFLLMKKCEIKVGKTNKQYLNLELSDKSSSLIGFMWERFEDFYSTAEPGLIVKASGSVDEFNGQTQLRVNQIRLAIPSDNVSLGEFVPRSKRDLNEMLEEFNRRINEINDEKFKELLKLIFKGEAFEKYCSVPAGKAWHHAYLHGLLEHTLEIVKICDLCAQFHPEIDKDLLACGALLHDFGKIEELTSDSVFDYTDKGRLLGHIVIAAIEISNKAEKIKDFPKERLDQLLHLVLSHQGKLEHASPVEPKTLEAIVLYHSDELSAKANAYKSAIQAENNGENRWTKYLPLVESALYIPKYFGEIDDGKETNLFNQY